MKRKLRFPSVIEHLEAEGQESSSPFRKLVPHLWLPLPPTVCPIRLIVFDELKRIEALPSHRHVAHRFLQSSHSSIIDRVRNPVTSPPLYRRVSAERIRYALR